MAVIGREVGFGVFASERQLRHVAQVQLLWLCEAGARLDGGTLVRPEVLPSRAGQRQAGDGQWE